jgi:hypothetical protein
MRTWLWLVVAGLVWLMAPGRSEARRAPTGSGGGEPAAHNGKAVAPDASETNQMPAKPFDAALAAWPLLAVVIAVAGFSQRWNYYYNFGVTSLVLQTPITSYPIYAVDIIRTLDNVGTTVGLFIRYSLAFEAFILIMRLILTYSLLHYYISFLFAFSSAARTFVTFMRLFLLILVAFYAGGAAGFRAFQAEATAKVSTLPKVTLIRSAGAAGSQAEAGKEIFPLTCRSGDDLVLPPQVNYLGDSNLIKSITALGAVCSGKEGAWRLLYRDEKFSYIFETIAHPNKRPTTLIIPNEGLVVALE